MSDIVTAPVGDDWHEQRLGPGARLGRYELIGLLGAGGMGIVFSARDPELGRDVAVKILRSKVPARDQAGAARLRREGVAMARLTHPNVIRVYDVGLEGEHVFVAMELVRGTDLASWLARAPRTDAEILRVFVEAGRGLAAAHDAGLVHRDFKPQNVLVGDDGRVLVTDFGLAREVDAPDDDDALRESPRIASPIITAAGTVVGTPAYMAPEQRGGAVDARADQYSYCVALARALARAPHGDASPVASTVAADRAGEAVPTVAPPRVRAGLRAALTRGLAVDPRERFASMHELLAALEPRRRGGAPWAIAGGAALVAAVATAWLVQDRAAAAPRCPLPAAEHARVWGLVRQSMLRARLDAIDPAQGEARFAAATRRIEPYLATWSAQRVDACEDTRVHGRQSDELLDLRMACLDRGLHALDGAVARLATAADGAAIESALRGLALLEELDACGDPERARRRLARPAAPDARRAAAALEREVAQVRLDVLADRMGGAVDRATALVARARALGHPPSLAAALDVLARAQLGTGDHAQGETTLRELAQVAAAAHDDRAEAYAWTTLVTVIGVDRMKPADALALVPAASAAVLRAGDPVDLRVELLRTEASVIDMGPRLDDALALLAEARRLLDGAAAGPTAGALAVLRGKVLRETAWVHLRKTDHDRAIAIYEEAIAVDRDLFGPDSFAEALARHHIGEAYKRSGRHAEAIAAYREAARINRRAAVPGPRLSMNVLGVATTLGETGDWEGAIASFAEARALLERSGKPDDNALLALLAGLARAYGKVGRLPEAERTYADLLARFERTGASSINHPIALHNRGELYLQHGRLEEAIADFDRAIALFTQLLGPDASVLVHPRTSRATALAKRRRAAR